MEVNIYEDIFKNALTGNIFVADTENLISNLPIIGQETLSLKIKTPNFDEKGTNFDFREEHKFNIFKISLSTELSHSSNIYKLEFASPEILQNLRVRVSKSYTQNISDITEDLLTNTKYIGTTKELHIEPTRGIRRYVCPNNHPYTVIQNLLKESISNEISSPHYLFFENSRGIHFRSLQDLYKQPSSGHYHSSDYIRTNERLKEGATHNTLLDMTRILRYEMITNNDMMVNIVGGMLGSKNITHDIYNKNYATDEFDYFKDFDKYDRISIGESNIVDNPRYFKIEDEYSKKNISSFPDSDIHLIPTSTSSGKDASHINGSYTPSQLRDVILDRKSRWIELVKGIQVNFEAHGHTGLSAGDMINLVFPNPQKSDASEDSSKYYKGRFLITKIRHKFVNTTAETHLIIISAFRDSLPESLPV